MDPFRINEDALIKPSLLENDPVFLEKKSFTICDQCIFALSLESPLGKGRDPFFEQTLPKDALCQVWIKIGSLVLERKIKM